MASQRRPLQTYVEDCPDTVESAGAPHEYVPWFSTPTVSSSSGPTPLNTNPPASGVPTDMNTEFLLQDLQDALSGAVDFSSAEIPGPYGISDITLEDVLSGAGLLEAVLDTDDDERPLPPSLATHLEEYIDDEPELERQRASNPL